MKAPFWCALSMLAALPAVAHAGSITETHERVSTPGKTTVAFRPIAQVQSTATKCHPEASKAVACEAAARYRQREALAAKSDAAPAPLNGR